MASGYLAFTAKYCFISGVTLPPSWFECSVLLLTVAKIGNGWDFMEGFDLLIWPLRAFPSFQYPGGVHNSYFLIHT
jgi:hypothetical protein